MKINDPLSIDRLGEPCPRFDMRFQQNIEEIDNGMEEMHSKSKMEFLRNEFRKDVNTLTNNIIG